MSNFIDGQKFKRKIKILHQIYVPWYLVKLKAYTDFYKWVSKSMGM